MTRLAWLVAGLLVAPSALFATVSEGSRQTDPASQSQAESMAFDVLLRGGTVVDGTGAAPVVADVGIRDGRIVAVRNLSEESAAQIVDATGLYVAPGFIDLHSHAEVGLSDPYLSVATNNLLQGVTTVVVGQDGRHAWPLGGSFEEQVALWRSQGIGNNVIPLVGQGAARLEAMGVTTEPATEEQKGAIRRRIDELLAQGAWGLSSGLSYDPGRYSPPEEVVDAARPLKQHGGFYISHLRDQSDGFLDSVAETIRLCEETGVPVVVTHIKVGPRKHWGEASKAVALIEAARAKGLPVFADLYPYDASIDGLNYSLVPVSILFRQDELRGLVAPTGAEPAEILRWGYRLNPSLQAYIDEDFLLEHIDFGMSSGLAAARSVEQQPVYRRRLRDLMAIEASRAALLALVGKVILAPGGPDVYRIVSHPDRSLVGLTLADVADARGLTPAEAGIQLTLEGTRIRQVQLSEQDVITFVTKPYVVGGSDGDIPEFGDVDTHPRSYGTFTRRIRRYVYELGVIDLPFAIQTATGRTAEILGLTDRGLVRVGQWADVIVFDPERITDRASYVEPHHYSEGVEWVFVNGKAVVQDGRPNGLRAGRVLLKTGKSSR